MESRDVEQLVDDDDLEANQQIQDNEFESSTDQVDNSNSSDVQPEPTKPISQVAAFFITTNVTVGAGLLAMPWNMNHSGLYYSLILQLIFLILIIATCVMCTQMTFASNSNSYQQMVRSYSSTFHYKLTQFTMFAMVFSTVIAYIYLIGDQSDRMLASLSGPDFNQHWYMNRNFIMTYITLLVMFPLCSAKTVDFLKYGGVVGAMSLKLIIYVACSELFKHGRKEEKMKTFPEKTEEFFSVLPVICLAYICHLSWIPIAGALPKREKFKSCVTVSISMILASIIYTIVSVMAVLEFGNDIKADLTENYGGKDWIIIATVAVVGLKYTVTMPAVFLPIRLSLIDLLSQLSEKFNNLREPVKRFSVTLITLLIALLLAIFVPSIVGALDLLGALSVILIFVIPAICYKNYLLERHISGHHDSSQLQEKIKIGMCWFMLILGLLLVVPLFVISLLNMKKRN